MTVEPMGARARRFEFLDLVRLLCAGSVVLFHYGAMGPYSGVLTSDFYLLPDVLVYGQFGVHIFFMISGFVITLSARGRQPITFLWARFLRLYPAYWICCTISALVLLAAGPIHPTFWTPSLSQYLLNLTMLQSFVNVPDVDHAYWSLAIELRFYALVALCLLVRIRIDALWLLAGWLLVCVAAPYVPSVVGKAAMATYAPYFIVGILIQRLVEPKHRAVKLALIAAALALAAQYIFTQHAIHVQHDSHPYSPAIAVAVVWIGAALVACCVFAPAPSERATRTLMAVGATTYPLYLLHLAFGFAIMARLQGKVPAAILGPAVTVLMVAIVLIVALRLEPALRSVLRRAGLSAERRVGQLRTGQPAPSH